SSVSQPPAPAAACSSPRTCDSRACRGSPQVRLERLDRLLVDTGSPPVGLHPQPRLPDQPLGNPKRLPPPVPLPPPPPPPPPLPSSSRDDAVTVDRPASQDDPPPSLRPYYRASSLPRGGPPLCPASVLGPSRIGRLGISLPHTTAGHRCATGRPRARDDRFPRSTPKPGPSSRHLHAGRHLGSKQVSPRLIPGPDSKPGFAVLSGVSDTSSVVRFRSPS